MRTDSPPDKRKRTQNDPHRATRIADAAIAVVAERGVAGLTHRAVAARAGVPLGSTTYYFATLDDLLGVALSRAAQRNAARLRAWEADLGADVDLPAALADLMVRALTDERPQTLAEYELYVAALHRPSLREASAAWDAALTEVFISRTDPQRGRLLATAFCGALMQGLLADPPPTRGEAEEIFRPAVNPARKNSRSEG
jgi:DNA-binding transcriptional regulator YbjK